MRPICPSVCGPSPATTVVVVESPFQCNRYNKRSSQTKRRACMCIRYLELYSTSHSRKCAQRMRPCMHALARAARRALSAHFCSALVRTVSRTPLARIFARIVWGECEIILGDAARVRIPADDDDATMRCDGNLNVKCVHVCCRCRTVWRATVWAHMQRECAQTRYMYK